MTRDVNSNQRAQDFVNAAWDAIDQGQNELAATKARQAIGINSDEVDAYVALAMVVRTSGERQALLREAIRIGKRRLADELNGRDRSRWRSLELRPYMRAIGNLATTLSADMRPGALAEAATLAKRLLRMNPDDNQGMRFLLLEWLPQLGKWDEAAKVARRYARDRRTETSFWNALYLFRAGDQAADKALDQAIAINPHVVEYLSADRKPEPSGEVSAAYMSRAEAQNYAAVAFEPWQVVPGAAGWLRSHAAKRS